MMQEWITQAIAERMQTIDESDLKNFYDENIWAYVRACRIGGMECTEDNQDDIWTYVAQQVEEIWLPSNGMNADDIENGGDTEIEWHTVVDWCNSRSWDLLGWN